MAFPGLSATLRLGLTVAEGLNSYYCMAEDDAPLLLLLLYPAGQGSRWRQGQKAHSLGELVTPPSLWLAEFKSYVTFL